MKVSVIIPTYNYAAYVREAIDSVLAQTVQDFHIVVVDDGSTDDTQAVLATIDDPRVEIVRTPNRGICAACNEGLARARGEFIGFLGADDRWRPDKLERQLQMMDAEPDIVAVMTNFVRFNEKGFYPQDQFAFFPELSEVPTRPTRDGGGFRLVGDAFCTVVGFTEFPTWSGVLLFRAKAIKGLLFAREGLHKGLHGDVHFSLRAFRRGGLGFIEKPLVEVRRHGENATSRSADMSHAKLAALRLIDQEQLSDTERTVLRKRIGRSLIDVGLQNAADGRRRAASKDFARAFGIKGTRLSALKNFALLALPTAARTRLIGT